MVLPWLASLLLSALSAIVEKLLLLLPASQYCCVCSLRIQDLVLGNTVLFAGSKPANKGAFCPVV